MPLVSGSKVKVELEFFGRHLDIRISGHDDLLESKARH